MGRGDDELGQILIRGFFHALGQTTPPPDTIIFFNSGVKLVVDGSPVLEDLQALCGQGVRDPGVRHLPRALRACKDKAGGRRGLQHVHHRRDIAGAGKVIRTMSEDKLRLDRTLHRGRLSGQTGPGALAQVLRRCKECSRSRIPRPAGGAGEGRRRGRLSPDPRAGGDPHAGLLHAHRGRSVRVRRDRGRERAERRLCDGRRGAAGAEHLRRSQPTWIPP